MTYNSIVVCLDNNTGASRIMEFSIDLAARHSAHLTALHITYGPLVPFDPFGQAAQLIVEWEETVRERQKIAESQFMEAAKRAGINFDWVGYRSSDRNEIIARARASDLTIFRQRDPDDFLEELSQGFQDAFVLKLGRPVLLIPFAGGMPKAFDKIVVAWDGGREAMRALTDALPFLQQAKKVIVLTVAEKKDAEHDLPDVDVAAYLARHDVKVIVERDERPDGDPEQWLLTRVADFKADLLVMGAYGHNRLSEQILGGVTRSILRKAFLPVLMSH